MKKRSQNKQTKLPDELNDCIRRSKKARITDDEILDFHQRPLTTTDFDRVVYPRKFKPGDQVIVNSRFPNSNFWGVRGKIVGFHADNDLIVLALSGLEERFFPVLPNQIDLAQKAK